MWTNTSRLPYTGVLQTLPLRYRRTQMSYKAAELQANCWDTELRSVSTCTRVQQGGRDYWQKTTQVVRQRGGFPRQLQQKSLEGLLMQQQNNMGYSGKASCKPLFSFTPPGNEVSFKRKWRDKRKNSSLRALHNCIMLCRHDQVHAEMWVPEPVLDACAKPRAFYFSWEEREPS